MLEQCSPHNNHHGRLLAHAGVKSDGDVVSYGASSQNHDAFCGTNANGYHNKFRETSKQPECIRMQKEGLFTQAGCVKS